MAGKRVTFLIEMILGEGDSTHNVADSLVGEARRLSASSAGKSLGLARILASSEPPRSHWDFSSQMYRWDKHD